MSEGVGVLGLQRRLFWGPLKNVMEMLACVGIVLWREVRKGSVMEGSESTPQCVHIENSRRDSSSDVGLGTILLPVNKRSTVNEEMEPTKCTTLLSKLHLWTRSWDTATRMYVCILHMLAQHSRREAVVEW